jgi:hypothetical protein
MAFFGNTYHGEYNALLRSQPACRPVTFDAISDETFEVEFKRRVLGDSPTAAALKVCPDVFLVNTNILSSVCGTLQCVTDVVHCPFFRSVPSTFWL